MCEGIETGTCTRRHRKRAMRYILGWCSRTRCTVVALLGDPSISWCCWWEWFPFINVLDRRPIHLSLRISTHHYQLRRSTHDRQPPLVPFASSSPSPRPASDIVHRSRDSVRPDELRFFIDDGAPCEGCARPLTSAYRGHGVFWDTHDRDIFHALFRIAGAATSRDRLGSRLAHRRAEVRIYLRACLAGAAGAV